MRIIKIVVSTTLAIFFIFAIVILSITLKAVKFESESLNKTKFTIKNSTLKEPSFKLKENVEIQGWYLDEHFQEQWLFDVYKVDKKLTLYGKELEAINANVYRDSKLVSEYLFKDYEEYKPIRLGYRLEVLYLDKNFETKLTANLANSDNGINIYEKWEIETRELAILTIDLEDTLLSDIDKENYVNANMNLFNTSEEYELKDVLAGFRGRDNTVGLDLIKKVIK